MCISWILIKELGIIYTGKLTANAFFKLLISSRPSLTLECVRSIMNYKVCYVGDERVTVNCLVCKSVKDSSNLSLK